MAISEVDTVVWRYSAQKKPPLHAHRLATTCEVTCEGASLEPNGLWKIGEKSTVNAY